MTENELAVVEKLRHINSHQITHERAIDVIRTACAERDQLRAGLESIRSRAADASRKKDSKVGARLAAMVATDCYAVLHGKPPAFDEHGEGELIDAALVV